MKIDLELVTGFIGAGKSVFINSLIKLTKIKDEKILLIVTESGHVKSKSTEKIKVIFYENDIKFLNLYLIEQIQLVQPDRIIIEYNGTNTVDEFFKFVYKDKFLKLCKLKSIYYIIKYETYFYYFKNMSELFIPYIENCNLIIVNSDNQLINKDKDKIYKFISSFNPMCHIIFIEKNMDICKELINSNLFLSKKHREIKFQLKKLLFNNREL